MENDKNELHHHYSHTHDPKTIQAIIRRLSQSQGHIEAVKKMLASGRDCSDVLMQLAAVRSEINNAGKVLLKEHMSHCIVEAIHEGDPKELERLNQAIDMFIK